MLLVHHGHGQKVVFAQTLGHVLLVVHSGNGNHVGFHDLLDGVLLIRQQQRADRDQSQQVAAGIGDIADIDGFLVNAGAPDTLERVGHGHVPLQVHKLGGHDRPGGVLRVLENLVDAAAGLRVGMTEDAFDHAGRHFLDQIHRIIHVQLVQHFLQLCVGKGLDEQLLLLRLHFHEDLRRQFLGQEAVDQREPVLGQLRQNGGDVRRFKKEKHLPDFLPSLSRR